MQVNAAQKSGSLFGIVDSRMGEYPSEYVENFIALAVRCCQDKPEMRPCILDVVRELENVLQLVPESMSMSDITSLQSHSTSSTTNTSFSNNVSKYAQMSSDVSGSDLTTTVMPTFIPRQHLYILATSEGFSLYCSLPFVCSPSSKGLIFDRYMFQHQPKHFFSQGS